MPRTKEIDLTFLNQQPLPFLSCFKKVLRNFQHKTPLSYNEITVFGSRYGGKTHAFNWLMLTSLLADLPVTFYVMRFMKADVEGSIWQEFLSKLASTLPDGDLCGIKIETQYRRISRGQCSIHFLGLHIQKRDMVQLKGRFQYNTRYCCAIYEECDEMLRKEQLAIETALRSSKLNGQLLIINCGNPLLRANEFSLYVDENLPYNPLQMQQSGSDQILVRDTVRVTKLDGETEDVIIRKLFIRHAITANKFALANPDTMKTMQKWQRENPKTYEAWWWGKPVSMSGNAFTGHMKYIGYADPSDIGRYMGEYLIGLDFGITNNPLGSIVLFKEEKTGDILVIDDLLLEPRKHSHNAELLARAWFEWIIRLGNRHPAIKLAHIVVQCDWADTAFLQIFQRLQDTVYGMQRWISFSPCMKPPTEMHVRLLQSLMSEERLFIVRGRCSDFLDELTMAELDPNAPKIKLLKNRDHLLDAFVYAIAPSFSQLNTYQQARA